MALNRWHETGMGADEKSWPNTGASSTRQLVAITASMLRGSNLAPVISKPLAVLSLSSVIASTSRSDASRSQHARGRHWTGRRVSACTNDELLIKPQS